VAGLEPSGAIVLGVVVLALHLVSVTLTRALRTYSRSRLEERCARRGHPGRADDVARHDERTERSAEALAVLTGLTLAALCGVTADRVSPRLAIGWVVVIALAVGAVGYGVAGTMGRVFAEVVVDALWPVARMLRFAMAPFTFLVRQFEAIVYRVAGPADAAPRPATVEVEIPPSDGEDPDELDAEMPGATRELLEHAVEMTRLDVSEIMIPRSAIVSLPATVSARDAARTFRETGKSRIPLFGENRDDIVGVLYAKDLFPRMTDEAGPDAVVPRKLARAAYCVPETKNAFDLLDEFRSLRTQIAIVLDEYGGVSGLVTLEDLLEELVGTIDDEHDVPTPEDPVVALGGSRYEVDATLALEILNERLGLHLPTDDDYETVGGFAFHSLGRVPEPGARFRRDGVEFTIVEVADHSIRRVRLDLQPAAAVGSQ
jgi:CBS domain containing-hemolysin-like protein